MITPRRRLRRGHSVWVDSRRALTTQALPRVQIADVAVVGAGISGALCALELARDGHEVIVLDRRVPVTGSTLASTAMIQFEIDEPLSRLADTIGWSRAARSWQRSWRAVQALQRLVAREGIRCGMAPRRSLYLSGNAMDAPALEAEWRARQRAGLSGTWLTAAQLERRFGIARDGAIVSRGSAAADPVQLTTGLLRRAQQHGARIYSPANVRDVLPTRGGLWLDVEDDRAVLAQHVVFCTGYEMVHGVADRRHEIISTWAQAGTLTTPPPRWLRDMVVWEASDPYLYLRLHGNQVIMGGRDERHPTRYAVRAALAQKQRLVADDVRDLIPSLAWEPTHAWAGAFGSSSTGLPIIDRVDGISRAWVVAGLGGNGITYSMIAAQIIRSSLRGETDPDSALYRR